MTAAGRVPVNGNRGRVVQNIRVAGSPGGGLIPESVPWWPMRPAVMHDQAWSQVPLAGGHAQSERAPPARARHQPRRHSECIACSVRYRQCCSGGHAGGTALSAGHRLRAPHAAAATAWPRPRCGARWTRRGGPDARRAHGARSAGRSCAVMMLPLHTCLSDHGEAGLQTLATPVQPAAGASKSGGGSQGHRPDRFCQPSGKQEVGL